MNMEHELGPYDRDSFNSFVYFPLEDAVKELLERQKDPELQEYVERALHAGVPEIMRGKPNLALFRHVATPNFEIHRFAQIADAFPDFNPIIFEYLEDKFADVNEWKYFLGRPRFYKGQNHKGEPIFVNEPIIDFTQSNGKKISSLTTHWGEGLVDMHHRLFRTQFPHLGASLHDLSGWLHQIGSSAKQYYKSFFSLFLRDGILFENFLPNGKEFTFTRDIIVPALLEIKKESGYKPLIVALEPTDIEGDHFWLSHPAKHRKILRNK